MNMQILHNINVNSSNISTKLFHTKKGKNMQMNFMHKVAKIGLVASLFAALSLSAAESARSITTLAIDQKIFSLVGTLSISGSCGQLFV